LILGVIYAAGWFIVLMLANLFAPLPTAETAPTTDGQTQIAGFYLAVILLHAPLTVMFWHAPALVHWHDVSPLKSLFFSVVACFRNFGAFAVYGIAWIAVFVAFGMLFGLLGIAIGGQTLSQAILMPLVMLMGAMFSTSIYFTFRDSFVATPDAPPETPGEST
jgi:hypothetical protein